MPEAFPRVAYSFGCMAPARLRRPCAPLCLACCFCPRCQSIFQVAMAAGFHLFPFRTEKLSPPAPMVLHTRGRVGSRRFFPGEGSLCDCAGALPCFWGYGKAVPGPDWRASPIFARYFAEKRMRRVRKREGLEKSSVETPISSRDCIPFPIRL